MIMNFYVNNFSTYDFNLDLHNNNYIYIYIYNYCTFFKN